jgi:hypothetical protein
MPASPRALGARAGRVRRPFRAVNHESHSNFRFFRLIVVQPKCKLLVRAYRAARCVRPGHHARSHESGATMTIHEDSDGRAVDLESLGDEEPLCGEDEFAQEGA